MNIDIHLIVCRNPVGKLHQLVFLFMLPFFTQLPLCTTLRYNSYFMSMSLLSISQFVCKKFPSDHNINITILQQKNGKNTGMQSCNTTIYDCLLKNVFYQILFCNYNMDTAVNHSTSN